MSSVLLSKEPKEFHATYPSPFISCLYVGNRKIWSELQGCQTAKFDPFLSLDCARVEGAGVGAQSKERKGSNFEA